MFRRKFPGSAVAVVTVLGFMLSFAAVMAAQNIAIIRGQVIDPDGVPWEGIIVKFVNDRGQRAQTVTDKEGKFTQTGLGGGRWNLEFFRGEQVIWRQDVQLTTGQQVDLPPINFKELIEKSPEGMAARKRQEEEKAKFEGMKAHFDSGVAALQAADNLQASLGRTPADQRAAVQEQIAAKRQTAIDEFNAAQQGLDEKDPNFSLILGNLGTAYKSAGKYEEAIAAYKRALAVKQDAGYYVGLAESQARVGQNAEAMASCAAIPPATHAASAATCYRNLGIVFYNASKFAEAIEPLEKATQIEPKNAQAWYVLGASLVPLADFKDEKGKLVMTPKPGTIEAYQKAIELDPNGPYGAQAKEGLAQLEQMGAGIDTKVRAGKRRN